ncbi:MAG: choice-of-anchor J domain-containing protein [Bacteroidetes bacterium]|nr:choice-of-anchor J domain-containing protein [Bacteroidota bacterium]
MKTITKAFLILICAWLGFTGCIKDDFDVPPLPTIPTGSIITIDSLRKVFQYYGPGDYEITTEMSVYATVIADELSGNLYKTVFVQDTTGGLCLTFPYSGGLYEGDFLRIALKGTKLTEYGGLIQLELSDVDSCVVKQQTGTVIRPKTVTVSDLAGNDYESRLIKLYGVEFDDGELGNTWADAAGKEAMDRTLTDCSNATCIVRSSGYANFAGETLPGGKGSMIAIASIYNTDIQLYIRRLSEVVLDSIRCDGSSPNVNFLVNKNFEDDNLNSGGWVTKIVSGTVNWAVSEYSNNKFAKASSFSSGDASSETWLISPVLDLSATANPVFLFDNACNYTGPTLEVYVSVTYNGTGTPVVTDWTQLAATLSAGGFAWVSSGNIDLSAYKNNNVYIAFRFQGSTSASRTWEVDNIKVKDVI